MKEYSLNQTIEKLKGPNKENIIVNNYWAVTALDRYYESSKANIEFEVDGESQEAMLKWDSEFSKAVMREDIDIANHGGVAMAWFLMSVLLDYRYVEQTEIGEGVDYRFLKDEPNDDELNFLNNHHYVEVSGILEETKTNTLKNRIKEKHKQIDRGDKCHESSSVIVTRFNKLKTVKETHK
ncbi:MAG: hypothetical protein ACOCP4_02690 [Candidatus Woesearchaeota archaeon]